jgi:hypothetical protein
MTPILARETRKAEKGKTGALFRKQKAEFSQPRNFPSNYVLYLQRTIGNHAVEGLFKRGMIQASLRIGQPNDMYEQEADRAAEQAMRMPEYSAISGQRSAIRSKDQTVQTTPG